VTCATVEQAHQVRQLIGLTGQYASVDEHLTGVENLVLAKGPEKMHMFGFTALFPVTMVGNVFVPIDTMPGWLQAWVKINPCGTSLMRREDSWAAAVQAESSGLGPFWGVRIWERPVRKGWPWFPSPTGVWEVSGDRRDRFLTMPLF